MSSTSVHLCPLCDKPFTLGIVADLMHHMSRVLTTGEQSLRSIDMSLIAVARKIVRVIDNVPVRLAIMPKQNAVSNIPVCDVVLED